MGAVAVFVQGIIVVPFTGVVAIYMSVPIVPGRRYVFLVAVEVLAKAPDAAPCSLESDGNGLFLKTYSLNFM
jgi:hypothetical protein